MLAQLVVQGACKGPASLRFCLNEPASPTNHHLLSAAPSPLKIISAFSNGTRDHHFIQHFRTAHHLRSRRCPRRRSHQRSVYSISLSPSGRCVLLRGRIPKSCSKRIYHSKIKPSRSKRAGFEVSHVSIGSAWHTRKHECDRHVSQVEVEPAVAPAVAAAHMGRPVAAAAAAHKTNNE